MRQVHGEDYLSTSEVTARFGWDIDKLNYFQRYFNGLPRSEKLPGERQKFWRLEDLQALYSTPEEELRSKKVAGPAKLETSGSALAVSTVS